MLIGITGVAGSGKDTFADFLQAESALTSVRRSFSGPLKAIVSSVYGEAYGVPRTAFYGSQVEKKADLAEYGLPGVSGRSIAQLIGTEGFRECGAPHTRDVWVRLLIAQYRATPEHLTVVTDLRFPEECEAIHAEGGWTIRMLRTPVGDVCGGIREHSSEAHVGHLPVKYSVDNRDLSLNDLRVQARQFLASLGIAR